MKAMSTRFVWSLVLCVGMLALDHEAPALALRGQAQGDSPKSASQKSDLDTLQQQLAARPNWTAGWWTLGTSAYDANRFDIAIPALQHVVGAAPQMGVAWNLLGLSQFGSKQYVAARASLEHAAALNNSDDPEVEHVAAYHLALLRIRDGSFQSAATLLRTTFGTSLSQQISVALGLAVLRVPLLPSEVDPSREALLAQVGAATARGADGLHDFAAAISTNPDVPLLHLAYAEALEHAGQSAQASAELQRELAIAPQNAAPWEMLAGLEQRAGHTQAARAADAKFVSLKGKEGAEEARSRTWFAFRSATAGPNDRKEGMQAFAAGQYALASLKLSGWAAEHTDDGTAWAVLGLSEFELHQYDEARVHLERGRSLGLQGDAHAVGAARFTLGLLLLRAGEFDRASAELHAAQRLLGESERMDIALGSVLLRRAAIPVNANDPLGRGAGKIEGMLLDSRYDEAFPAFRALLVRYPKTPYLRYGFGTALMALSEFDDAAKQMKAEQVNSPDSPLPYEGLASIALRQHRPSDAVENARLAIARSPNTAGPHYLLGRALLESGMDIPGAVRELQKAAQLDPNSPEVHYNLAKAYARSSDSAKAEQERAIFMRLNELSEQQSSGQTPRSYAGPRETDILSGAASSQNSPR